MKINIKDLINSSEQNINIIFKETISELENNNIVDAVLNVAVTAYGIKIKGQVKTDLKLICDRCLEEFDYHVEADIDEDFVNEKIVSDNKKDYELKKGEFVEELHDREDIDINDFLYQTVILEIPPKKICKDTCEGTENYKKIISEKYIDERLEVFKSFSENNYKKDKK